MFSHRDFDKSSAFGFEPYENSSLNCFYLLFITAPSGAPENIELTVLNTTAIEVKWDAVPLKFRRGIITMYKVFYKVGDDPEEARTVIVKNAKLTGLRQKTNYSVEVLAVTIKGDGVKSNPKFAETKGNSHNSTVFENTFHTKF